MCSRHPDRRASFTCSRCGGFGCFFCRSKGRPGLCQECAGRLPPVVPLLPMLPTLRDAGGAFMRHWRALLVFMVPCILGSLGDTLPPGGLDGVFDEYSGDLKTYTRQAIIFTVVRVLYLLTLQVGIAALLIQNVDGLRGRTDSTRRGPGHAVWRVLRVSLAQVVVEIAILAGTFLLLVPGVLLAIRLCLASADTATQGSSVGSALRRSWGFTRESRWRVLLFLALLVVLGEVLVVPMSWVTRGLRPLSPFVPYVMSGIYYAIYVGFFASALAVMYHRLTEPASNVER
jgi:hypothetical protein